MAYNNLGELFTDIANAIRGKTGGTDKIVANDFPAAIEGISGGGGVGGEASVTGCSISWTSGTEGKDVIDLSAMLGCKFYKVVDTIFSHDFFGGIQFTIGAATGTPASLNDCDGALIVMQDSTTPIVVTGRAGSYAFSGVSFDIPSDGTYFVHYGNKYLSELYRYLRV